MADQLLMHMNSLADGNIFAIYPKILEEIFLQDARDREEEDIQRLDLESMVLPSDMEFRLKAYFKLVQMQRDMDDQPDTEVSAVDKLRTARRWSRNDSITDPWIALIEADGSRRSSIRPAGPGSRNASITGVGPSRPSLINNLPTIIAALPGIKSSNASECSVPESNDSICSSYNSSPSPSVLQGASPPWGPVELAKAARLLDKPPLPVNFEDDQEMRKVYSLIFDVFRYKSIMEEALCDVGFYGGFEEASTRKTLTWLLLLDQQRRGWARRECTRSSLILLKERDSQESLNSRRKYSIGSDASNRSNYSSESSAHFKTSRTSSIDSKDGLFHRNLRSKGRGGKDTSPEARELSRKARVGTPDIMSGQIMPIMEDAKLEEFTAPQNVFKEFDRSFVESVMRNSPDFKKDSPLRLDSRNALNVPIVQPELSHEAIIQILLDTAGEIGPELVKFDEVLWNNKVKIAAAIAKIRIRKKALTLSDLLPVHLRDERMSNLSDRQVLTGWVNIFKSRNVTDLMQRLNEMGFSYSSTKLLDPNQFCLDRQCPKFIMLRPAHRKTLSSSSLITDKVIVLQEREFCLGAAALCRALRAAHLRGDVIQTHGTSPKAVAYLASQLKDQGPEAGGLMVFGAGDRKSEYEGVLRSLGVTNARVFAENAWDVANGLWAGAVAALATPPNSYSAVLDPVDLVCSRGGDLGMLEVLTESQINMDGKMRVMNILEEQKKTLRLCMSKPQIQMIVYETHSVLGSENGEMVRRAVAEANRAVRELHALRRQKMRDALPRAPKCAQKIQQQTTKDITEEEDSIEEDPIAVQETKRGSKSAESAGENNKDYKKSKADKGSPKTKKGLKKDKPKKDDSLEQEKNDINEEKQVPGENVENIDKFKKNQNPADSRIDSAPSANTDQSNQGPVDPDSEFADIKVPDCDIFEEIHPSPLAEMTKREREGCYVALIQRKEIIRLNAKYMIQVAEARGLFGSSTPAQAKRPPPTKQKVIKEEKIEEPKRRLSDSQIERIAAPTHAWSAHITVRSGSETACCSEVTVEAEYPVGCEPCARRHAPAEPRARRWWREAAAAVRSEAPLRLPRRRTRLPLRVSEPLLDVESPIACRAEAVASRLIDNITRS